MINKFTVGHIIYGVIVLLSLTQLHKPMFISLLFVFACLYAIWQNKAYSNVVSLLFILLIFKVIELVVWGYIENSSIYAIHSFYLLLDIIVTLVVGFRPALCRQIDVWRTGGFDKARYVITNADLFVGVMYSFYALFNILMLIEHSLRHLEDFGLKPNLWLFEHARFLWSNHAMIKLPLNIIEFIIIYSTVQRYMRSTRVLGA